MNPQNRNCDADDLAQFVKKGHFGEVKMRCYRYQRVALWLSLHSSGADSVKRLCVSLSRHVSAPADERAIGSASAMQNAASEEAPAECLNLQLKANEIRMGHIPQQKEL